MQYEFIREIESWGSGGYMMDIVVLKDGRLLVIAEYGITLYANRADFESGASGTPLE